MGMAFPRTRSTIRQAEAAFSGRKLVGIIKKPQAI